MAVEKGNDRFSVYHCLLPRNPVRRNRIGSGSARIVILVKKQASPNFFTLSVRLNRTPTPSLLSWSVESGKWCPQLEATCCLDTTGYV